MEHAFFYRLSSILWKAIVSIIVALAIYVSFGRFLMSNVGTYGDEILRELNARSIFMIEAEEVTGEWHSFTPELVLTGLQLTVPGGTELPLKLAEGRIAIDVWDSLQTRSLQTYRVSLDRLFLRGELTEEGKLLIAGMGEDNGTIPQVLEKLLLNIEQLDLIDNQLFLDLPDGSQRLFDLDLILRREGSLRRVEAELVSKTTGTEITVLAKGLGNPRDADNFSGELYLDVVDSDLLALLQIFQRDPAVQLSGELDLQAWLTWDSGQPAVEAEITGRDITIEEPDEDWQLPLDDVFVKLSLMRSGDHWTLFTSDLQLRMGDNSLQLPRVQLDVWGDSLRLRSVGIPLAPINALFLGLDTTTDVLAEVFRTLDPSGELTSLQLNVADYHVPGQDWELTGNFNGLEVQSWRGAPGIKAERGYVQLAPDGGFVILDSHQFAMDFPTVYREPLRFDDFYGTIYIDWTSTDVTLSSGLALAEGIEGTATVLFGLNIPLVKTDVGLEMDLLVGLKNTHPIHRTKYLPYTLNDALLRWLQGSIGEGRIEEGAFLWRGSLRRKASAMRTVQLFLNVADTNLNYYAGWPSLSGFDGLVLIDDTEVSVWSEQARLYDSRIDFLSAEAWLNEDRQMMLAITSTMVGDAADGLKTINQSPLGSIVGGAFTGWELAGELETRLELQLNLTDIQVPPRVEVKTRWHDVDLLINPGGLEIDGISGQLAYSSGHGFSSADLAGTVWGKALQAQVRQASPVADKEQQSIPLQYDAASSMTEIQLSTRVDMADVRQWLKLDLLSLAAGETAAELLVEIPPGLAPRIAINTDLTGVSLDLPDPWYKAAEASRPLKIEVPLSGDARVVNLDLDEELYLQILFSGPDFDGVALGFQRLPDKVRPAMVHVSGHAALVDEARWQRFLEKYIYAVFVGDRAGDKARDPGEDVSGDLEEVTEEDLAQEQILEIHIENLEADTLLLYGQELSDVTFSLEKTAGNMRLSGETEWVRGELLLKEDGSAGKLSIEHLELTGLSELNFDSGGGDSFDIPYMDVVLADLRYEEQALGELEFTVRSEEELLRVEGIVGSLAGLILSPEHPGSLLWSRESDASKTRLETQLEFQDLGQTLEKLTYQNIIETDSGKLDVALEWPGGPQDFSLESVQGFLGLDIAEGRFLDTPAGASGTLRVVGILNLADIVQRLSLDLPNMFESGIPFHSIEGEVFFHGGSIEVAKMDVEGRGSGFHFTGVSDVASQRLDGELIATLPVASNLPWVAALAMGLPVAAGVFVFSKVFEEQMNRVSSAVYKISGSWEDPKVNFDRIFDTSSARKAAGTGTSQEVPGASLDANTPTDPELADPYSATSQPATPQLAIPQPAEATPGVMPEPL